MSDHYYSKNPEVESKPRRWSFRLRGFSFTFETDAGVFSKSEVDFGSRVLIDELVAVRLVVAAGLSLGLGLDDFGFCDTFCYQEL